MSSAACRSYVVGRVGRTTSVFGTELQRQGERERESAGPSDLQVLGASRHPATLFQAVLGVPVLLFAEHEVLCSGKGVRVRVCVRVRVRVYVEAGQDGDES